MKLLWRPIYTRQKLSHAVIQYERNRQTSVHILISNMPPLFSVQEYYRLQVQRERKHCLPAFPFDTTAASFLNIASAAWSDTRLAFLRLSKASHDSLTAAIRSGSFSDFWNNKIHPVLSQQLKNNPSATHSAGTDYFMLACVILLWIYGSLTQRADKMCTEPNGNLYRSRE